MNLSVSNIAWTKADDENIYKNMSKYRFSFLEIAPSEIAGSEAYTKEGIKKSKDYLNYVFEKYGICICSMQSILYGISYRLFYDDREREKLFEELKKAVFYASSINCKNLVFGSPKNRVIKDKISQYDIAVQFFKKIADYARKNEVCISMEANPKIYNTNFINTTKEAKKLVDDVNSSSFKINYDLGTVIYNEEDINYLNKIIQDVNHIHISEPFLENIEKRKIHKELYEILRNTNYNKCVSIEMKKSDGIYNLINAIKYVSEIFEIN